MSTTTLAVQLKNLKRGDVLVYADGEREKLRACDLPLPSSWSMRTGKYRRGMPHWNIVRVIVQKPRKPAIRCKFCKCRKPLERWVDVMHGQYSCGGPECVTF